MEIDSSPSVESTGLSGSSEAPQEKSEKQKESYKKAQAQLQKAQKDEKKAQWDNNELFQILLRFIQNPYYEELIPLVTTLLAHSVPSRYTIALISLFYPEATLYMLSSIQKKDDISLLLALHHYKEETDFHESTLHESIRTWMSTWVHHTKTYLVEDTGSTILRKKLSDLLSTDDFLLESLTQTIQFFFTSRNLKTPLRVSRGYAQFLRKEYAETLQKSLSLWDKDLLENGDLSDTEKLFWL